MSEAGGQISDRPLNMEHKNIPAFTKQACQRGGVSGTVSLTCERLIRMDFFNLKEQTLP